MAKTQKSFELSRRSALKGSVTGVLGLSVMSSQQLLADTPTRKIAIIGGGMGGIASAYFLGTEFAIDLFESRAKVGGHADSVAVEHNGKPVVVDLGAQFIHPDTHPLYWSLITDLGLYRANDQANDEIIDGPATLSIFDGQTGKPLFTSTKPFDNLIYAIGFGTFASEARKAINDLPWDVTLSKWISDLKVDEGFKTKVLTPWLASLESGRVEMSAQYSARSTLSTFAKTFPENIFITPHIFNSKIGLEGILQFLLAKASNVNTLLNAAVVSVEKVGNEWFIDTADGRHGPYESVVVNAQPNASKKFLASHSEELAKVLDGFQYYDTRIAIHQDSVTLAKDKAYWSAQNAQVEGNICEGSIALGLIQPEKEGLFKSWAAKRKVLPNAVLAEREFKHSYVTKTYLDAVRDLHAWQGQDGLYFAGHFTTGCDLQETALYSAMQVARALSPEAANLKAFEARLVAEKKDQISYIV